MIETAVELALGNVLISSALAVLAYAVHRHGRYPALAHLLWVLVLVKVVTPPLLVLSLPFGTSVASPDAAAAAGSVAAGVSSTVPSAFEQGTTLMWRLGPALLVLTWAVGSVIALVVSVRRIHAFGQLLSATSAKAPRPVEHLTATVGEELGLRSVPPVFVTGARISPMTWWSRGRVRLVLPASLLRQADGPELRWVIAHELAHVKRRDHLVRWVEWLASVAFWWNPVVWVTRRYLRLDEEDACDALVLEHIEGAARAYASALLDAVEALSAPRGHAPAMATGMDAARSLEHRLYAIVNPDTRRRAPRPLVGGLTIVAVAAMAVGVGGSADPVDPDLPDTATLPGAVADAAVADEPAPATVRYSTVSASLGDGVYVGTSRNDEFAGSAIDEEISGFAGADELSGGGGKDTIRGGAGADTIRGGAGRDELHGGAGADVIRGGAGRDTIDAGAGNDTVYTWSDGQPDQVDCGDGRDRAVIDSTDSAQHCEDVVVRDPS